jgi:hypothetical protein
MRRLSKNQHKSICFGYFVLAGERRLGHTRYELSNHLRNVFAFISDRKKGIDSDADGLVTYYTADVIQAKDYSPYGPSLAALLVPPRSTCPT